MIEPEIVWTASVKGTALLALAWMVSLAIRRASAAARHLLWSMALGGLLALPLLLLVMPAWHVRVVHVPALASFESAAATGAASPARVNWEDLAFFVWLAGAAALGVRLLVAWTSVWRWARGAKAVDSRVPMLESDRVAMPMAWRDCLTQVLARVACCFYWFHPLVWLAAREMQREAERACDDRVLRAGAKASAYAGHLLAVAQTLRPAGYCWATVAMARRSQLEGRLLDILDPHRDRRALTRGAAAVAALAVASLVFPLAALSPQQPEKPYKVGDGVTAPRLIERVEPKYTEEAKDAGIQGQVELSVEVEPDGRIHKINVNKSLDPGLDERAMEAIRQWRFEPARKDGKPVTVRALISINFRLADEPPDGLVKPRLISRVEPDYTEEAKNARIEGEVELSLEVQPDGRAHKIRVEKGLDPGLDENAVKAVSQWRFEPGKKDGEAAAMAATVVVRFRLK
ncbi:MAG: M56 family metallopeptidase [Acidobacteria bacterium]|nr:M56 family metallopeptidase [Acidobacteriota bacterium]